MHRLFPEGWGPVGGKRLPGWEPLVPGISPSSLPLFLRVNPFPAPPPARLGLLNAFAESEAGAQPGAFVTRLRDAARGWGGGEVEG